jgi:3-hydroxyisobutyrate dehydrogenase-like beta-hydroxyacid dehydrogenase
MASETYGFVGVGHMGGPMATRLLNAGSKVIICDTDEQAVASLVALGAQKAVSAAEVANRVDCVFLSLPTPDIVKLVALGQHGVSEGTKAKTVVDFSTIGPRAASAVAEGLAKHNIAYVDAPVSGGVSGARAGTLAVMVSCPKELSSRLQAILSLFGKVFHVGESAGQAQTVKLANNLLSATAIAVSSEAMVMGAKAGLDPKIMLDVINAGSGRNSATQDKFPRSILPGTFDYGFGTGLAYKDVRLCIDEAESLGVPMVVGAAVRELLAVTNSIYGGESDYTSICKVVESWAGVAVRSPISAVDME